MLRESVRSTMAIFNKVFFLFFLIICTVSFINGEMGSRPIQSIQQYLSNGGYYLQPRMNNKDEKVNIQLLYECLCYDCILFDTKNFKEVVLKLNQYVHIRTYPYGNAQTFDKNGTTTFKCQHGPEECYGNKLHVCALDIIKNHTEALLFNICLMDNPIDVQGSDDKTADKCGTSMNIDSKSIKACAKSDKGTQLLKYYGVESKKIKYNYVPFILINGEVNDGDNFMRDVCAAFAKPPPPCAQFIE